MDIKELEKYLIDEVSSDAEVLINEVVELIEYVKKEHRYSVSRIFNLWNKIFKRNEAHQSCVSCLVRKVHELERWLDLQKSVIENKEVEKNERPKSRNKNK